MKPVMEVIVVVRFPGISDTESPEAEEALANIQQDLESEIGSRGYHWAVGEVLIVDDDSPNDEEE